MNSRSLVRQTIAYNSETCSYDNLYVLLFKNQCIKNILIQNSVCYQTITLAAANIVRKCDGELEHTTFRLYISAAVDAAR